MVMVPVMRILKLGQWLTRVVDGHTDTGEGDGNALQNPADDDHGDVLGCCQDDCGGHESNAAVHHHCK